MHINQSKKERGNEEEEISTAIAARIVKRSRIGEERWIRGREMDTEVWRRTRGREKEEMEEAAMDAIEIEREKRERERRRRTRGMYEWRIELNRGGVHSVIIHVGMLGRANHPHLTLPKLDYCGPISLMAHWASTQLGAFNFAVNASHI